MITSTIVYLRAMYINCYCESSYSELLEYRQFVLIDVLLRYELHSHLLSFQYNP